MVGCDDGDLRARTHEHQERYTRAVNDPALERLRLKPIVETTAADLLAVLRMGTKSTNHFLRRLHNLAVGLGWLNWPLLAPKLWPKTEWRKNRGITREQHQKIVSTEINPERRLYYDLLWETGGSQSDIVKLTDANVDWKKRILWYRRSKLGEDSEPACKQRGKIPTQILGACVGVESLVVTYSPNVPLSHAARPQASTVACA